MQTMKVKPWGADQGDHVVINAADFDAAIHVPFEEPDMLTGDDGVTMPRATNRGTRRSKTQTQEAAQ